VEGIPSALPAQEVSLMPGQLTKAASSGYRKRGGQNIIVESSILIAFV
jgi:hypothetical protein